MTQNAAQLTKFLRGGTQFDTTVIVNEDLVERVEKLEEHQRQDAVTRRWIRRRVRALLCALVANLLAGGGYAVHYVKASGAAEAVEVQQGRDIARLEQDVRELRRVCGLDPQGIVQFGMLGERPWGR